MTAPPRISTFVRVNGACPHKWIAMFDGLPMMFKAATEQLAFSTAEDWWAEELRKAEDLRERLAKARHARPSRAKPSEAVHA